MSAEKYVLRDDKRARLVAEFYRGRVFLHLEVRQWGIGVAREFRARWPGVKLALKNVGFDRIYAYVQEERVEKFSRFVRPFGFSEVRRRNGFVLMEVSNA